MLAFICLIKWAQVGLLRSPIRADTQVAYQSLMVDEKHNQEP